MKGNRRDSSFATDRFPNIAKKHVLEEVNALSKRFGARQKRFFVAPDLTARFCFLPSSVVETIGVSVLRLSASQ
jgi:hypothetical protein